MAHVLVAEVCHDRALGQLGHGHSHQQAEGEDAIHQPTTKLGLCRKLLVEVKRLGVHGQGAEQNIVCFGDGPAQSVVKAITGLQLVVELAGHVVGLLGEDGLVARSVFGLRHGHQENLELAQLIVRKGSDSLV